MIAQILEALLAGVGLVFQAFFSMLPIYQQLSDLKNHMIAFVLGVPCAVVVIIGFLWKLIKAAVKK